MTGGASQPASLVGRLVLWSLVLLAVVIPLFWALFANAVEKVSRDVVDTRLLEFADQVRGHWVSTRANQTAPINGLSRHGPALRGHAGGADLDWVWQVSVAGTVALKSDLLTLTGAQLPIRPDPSDAFTLDTVNSPLGPLRIAERVLDEPLPFGQANGATSERLHYIVGLRLERYRGYVEDHAARLRGLALLAVIPVALALIGLSAVIILATRRNLEDLSDALHAYGQGDSPRVEGRFPRELQETVDRLNALIGQNEKILERTRKYVSKIAHDINHPLAILKNALRGGTDKDLMQRQVDRMAGLVDRYASLARAIGPDGQGERRTHVHGVLADIVDGFSILYRRTPLTFAIDCADDLSFPIPRHDLETMISNLVSNAHKYGDGHVRLSAGLDDGGGLVLSVEDDGPGIAEDDRAAALNWGKRLDEAPPGTGFGLSIVNDIAALYDGALTLSASELGGLKAKIKLPKPA